MTTPGAIAADVILCDYAQVWQGKLFISGAGIGIVGVTPEPPHQLSIHAAILVIVPWNAHNQLHTLTMGLYSQDETLIPLKNLNIPPDLNPDDAGKVVAKFNAGRAPIMASGDESILPVATPVTAQLPRLDSYHLVVSVDGSRMASARFRVLSIPQMLSGGVAPFSP